MTLIFYLSSQQKISVSPTYVFNFIIFKFLHVTEYAILYFLWWWAISNKKNAFHHQKYLWVGLFSLAFAISDEIHQTFVPTREGTVRDVCIDGIGITIMYIVINQSTIRKQLRKIWI